LSTLKILSLALLIATSAFAKPVEVKLVAEIETVDNSNSFWVALDHSLQSGWHTYWKNPGQAGMAPQISWHLPAGFQVEEVVFPTPEKFNTGDIVTFGYKDDFILLAKITAPKDFKGKPDISCDISFVVCSEESCLPQEVHATLEERDGLETKKLFTQARENLPLQKSFEPATLQGELVVFKLPVNTDSVQFFPEESDCIDCSIEPIVEKNQMILKAEKCPIERLKGVLVVDDSPYFVDVAVQQGSATEIGMADDLQVSKSVPIKHSLLLLVAFAFAGGLLLNLMPCVLPVISFKIMSFIKLAGKKRSLLFQHSASFCLGVLVSFWILAALLLTLRAWGHAVGWGFQLQEPIFVASVAALLFIFSLSLFGVFEIGLGLSAWAGQQKKEGEGLLSSFLSGTLATIVATPCTGPFMGTAVGAAVSMPVVDAFVIFTSLGLGMASPYLLLALFPRGLSLIPKPGNWMVRFKELMGFFLLASSLWLVWVFGTQTGINPLTLLLASFFIFAIGCWVFGTFAALNQKKWVRKGAVILSFLIFCSAAFVLYQATTLEHETKHSIAADWEPYDPQRVAKLQAEGVPVFVDFTASWCLICQANHLTLSTSDVAKQMQSKGVVRMKADYTRKDPALTKELEKHGRSGVPLYLYYAKGEKEPKILPQTLTPDIVLKAINDNKDLN
jgi:thiol:disulfide interchange protein DsbD